MAQSEIDAVRALLDPSHARLVGPPGENGSTRLVLFGPLLTTWN